MLSVNPTKRRFAGMVVCSSSLSSQFLRFKLDFEGAAFSLPGEYDVRLQAKGFIDYSMRRDVNRRIFPNGLVLCCASIQFPYPKFESGAEGFRWYEKIPETLTACNPLLKAGVLVH